MLRRALPAAERRSVASTAVVTLAVAGVVAAAVACGSEAPEPPEDQPGPESTTPASAPVAPPETEARSSAPTAGTPAPPVDPPATSAAAPQPPVAPIAPPPALPAAAEPRPQGDTSGIREFPAESVWEALRQCQSQGDYTFVHPSGEYFGAYQFTVATWDRLATQRYTNLLGILPSEADPADQDRMAYYLWIESGHARWPACSHVFTGDPPAEPVTPPPGDGGADATPVSERDGSPPGGQDTAQAPDAPGGEDAAQAPDAPGGEDAAQSSDEPAGTDGSGTATVESEAEATTTTTTSPADLPQPEIDPSVQPAIPPDVPGFPSEEQWEALRFCESSGNYRAVSRNGLYFGAYQFWPDTWDYVAERNYPRLVGVLPSHATPEDQTRMAYRLWEERGDQPWPVCGRHLRSAAG